jgi:hypothetical protein
MGRDLMSQNLIDRDLMDRIFSGRGITSQDLMG